MMRRLTFLLLLFLPLQVVCQDYTDSIRIFLGAHPQPDSAQLNKLLNYNVKLIYSQPQEAIANFERFEAVAKKIGCKSCLLWVLKDKSISIKNTGDHNGALETLFKALSLTTSETQTKAGILNNIANV